MKMRSEWRLWVVMVASLGLLTLGACDSDDGDDGGGGGGGAADTTGGGGTDTGGGGTADTGGGGGTTTFEAGTFQLTTIEVDDQCLDGGLAVLFQPEGPGTTYDLQFPTEFPGWADLPTDFTMQLQDPFSDMAVNLVADGEGLMKVENSTQNDVVVDDENYGDCNVDMVIDAQITIIDNDNLNVTAQLEVSDWTSSNETCPVVESDPCMITLTMTGARL